MKKTLLFLVVACVAMAMQATTVESVTACTGVNASTEMNISWAAYGSGTKVQYKKVTDNAATLVVPEYEHLCFTYDSIYSKRPDNENYYEGAVFMKCGAVLKNLSPDTEYTYCIVDANGNKTCEPHYFKTAGSAEWSCCVISDYHSYTPLGHRLTDAMAMLGQIEKFDSSIDWVLHLGDVCAWGGSWSFWREMYAHPYFSKYMWSGLNGNHDNMSRKYQLTNAYFRDANYVPRNGYEGEVGVCYHFRYGEVMFVMLNNEDMRTDEGFNAAVEWVRKVVTEARQSQDAPRYVVVCEHYQWFHGNNGKTSQYGRWSKIFDELGVDLALAGNDHIYARTGCLYDGRETDGSKGTVYLQTSSCDNERGRELEPLVANEDYIKTRFTEGGKTVSALNMKVDSQHIVLTLIDRYGNVKDQVEVKAKR